VPENPQRATRTAKVMEIVSMVWAGRFARAIGRLPDRRKPLCEVVPDRADPEPSRPGRASGMPRAHEG
jgi:hypothetical protein